MIYLSITSIGCLLHPLRLSVYRIYYDIYYDAITRLIILAHLCCMVPLQKKWLHDHAYHSGITTSTWTLREHIYFHFIHSHFLRIIARCTYEKSPEGKTDMIEDARRRGNRGELSAKRRRALSIIFQARAFMVWDPVAYGGPTYALSMAGRPTSPSSTTSISLTTFSTLQPPVKVSHSPPLALNNAHACHKSLLERFSCSSFDALLPPRMSAGMSAGKD